MRIAALYDVHGNLPALESVLEGVEGEAIDEVVVGGDVVPGPMPRACLDRLERLDRPVHFLHGNGERDTLAAHRGESLARVPERFHPTMRWTAERLGSDRLTRIARWPATVRLAIPGLGDVLFCHATPRDDNELFTRVTPDERLEPVFAPTGADLVVCGHTHMPFDRVVAGVRVINAGSVGMPFGETGAFWLVLDPEGPKPRRTEYDLDAAAERITASDYPGAAEFDPRRPPTEASMVELFEANALR